MLAMADTSRMNPFSCAEFFLEDITPPMSPMSARRSSSDQSPLVNGMYYRNGHHDSVDSDTDFPREETNQGNKFRSRSKSEGAVLALKSVLKKESSEESKVRRKVSFADSNGLELAKIQTFNEPSFDDIDDDDLLLPNPNDIFQSVVQKRAASRRRFTPYFTLPWKETIASKRRTLAAVLDERNVCLESFTPKSPWQLSGTMLVKNQSYEKKVFVRRTMDNWVTHDDVGAGFLTKVDDKNADRFIFELQFAFKIAPGARLEFAICYETPDGAAYWDNNDGTNYCFWFNDTVG